MKIQLLVLAFLVLGFPSTSEGKHSADHASHKQEEKKNKTSQEIVVGKPEKLVAEVKGIVCSFCAYGLEKNLSKLKNVNKNIYGDGILVDIKKGLITIALLPNEPIDFMRINAAIQKGGYELIALHVNLEGEVETQKGGTVLKNAYNNQLFQLIK